MRGGATGAKVSAMEAVPRRIGLEVDVGEGPLQGRMADGDGSVHEFEGWLGLLTVLGHLLDGPPPGDATSPPLTELD